MRKFKSTSIRRAKRKRRLSVNKVWSINGFVWLRRETPLWCRWPDPGFRVHRRIGILRTEWKPTLRFFSLTSMPTIFPQVISLNQRHVSSMIDSLGQTHCPRSDHYFQATFVLFLFEKWRWTYGPTDGNMCENNYQYRQELWVGRVDQSDCLFFSIFNCHSFKLSATLN